MTKSNTLCPPNTSEVRRALLGWAELHLRDYPWREDGVSVYQVLIAEVLLKRTTARAAARTYESFIARFPDLTSLSEAEVESIERALLQVGLYRQRAKGLKQMVDYLEREHDGQIPNDLASLERVPHLGPYSARAVLSFAHRQPAAIVDSNVMRVLGRLYRGRLGKSPTTADVQVLANAILPEESHRDFNLALLDLGATVCRYDTPRCNVCPLTKFCDYSRGAQI